MLHQQDGHSHQHSPVQRVLHVCWWIIALTFNVVIGVGKIQPATLQKSWKVLLPFSKEWKMLFIYFLVNSALLLTGWLEVTASTNAARNQSPSFSCGRQAGGARGKQAARRAMGFRFACRLFSRRRRTLAALILKSFGFLQCQDSITESLKLLSAAATRRGAAVHSLSLSHRWK